MRGNALHVRVLAKGNGMGNCCPGETDDGSLHNDNYNLRAAASRRVPKNDSKKRESPSTPLLLEPQRAAAVKPQDSGKSIVDTLNFGDFERVKNRLSLSYMSTAHAETLKGGTVIKAIAPIANAGPKQKDPLHWGAAALIIVDKNKTKWLYELSALYEILGLSVTLIKKEERRLVKLPDDTAVDGIITRKDAEDLLSKLATSERVPSSSFKL